MESWSLASLALAQQCTVLRSGLSGYLSTNHATDDVIVTKAFVWLSGCLSIKNMQPMNVSIVIMSSIEIETKDEGDFVWLKHAPVARKGH